MLHSCGRSHAASAESSKEITETWSGTAIPASASAWYAPKATRSFMQIRAAGRSPDRSMRVTASWAGSGHHRQSTVPASRAPAASSPARMPAIRSRAAKTSCGCSPTT
jgi:hypothetical protein